MTTAIFLGAGASKAVGFPLTSEILPTIRRRIQSNELFRSRESRSRSEFDDQQRRLLNELLETMLPGSTRLSDMQLPLITEILSVIDYSVLSASVSCIGQRRHQLTDLRKLLERAIVEVLDWPYAPTDVPPRLEKFAGWLEYMNRHTPDTIALISSNYDISVEHELFRKASLPTVEEEFDFGFEWRDPGNGRLHSRPAKPRCRIYKLHGSLNWLRCPLCDHIYINLRGSIIHQAFKPLNDDFNTCECDYAPLEPVIVTPSVIRDVRDSNLLELWRHSLEVLRGAERWVIIGYSFPPEDVAIRSMFMRAFSARKTKPEVVVVQRSHSPELEARYEVLFPNYRYEIGGMEAYIDNLSAD